MNEGDSIRNRAELKRRASEANMNTSSLITICVPCFNSAKTIGETLKSIRNQTLENIQIVVSDNASTDGSAEVVRRMASEDTRLVLHVQTENLGYCGNIQFLLDQVQTKYVAVFHSDDIYHKEILEKELMALVDLELDFVFVQMREFYDGRRYKAWRADYHFLPKGEKVTLLNKEEFFSLTLSHRNFLPTPSLCAKTESLKRLGGFTNRFPSNEDLDLWCRALAQGYRIGIVRQYLMDYRWSATSGTSMFRNRIRLPVFFETIEHHIVLGSFKPTSRISRIYSKRKARAASLVAAQARAAGKPLEARRFIERSLSYYKFSPISLDGLCQRFPTVVQALERAKKFIKG